MGSLSPPLDPVLHSRSVTEKQTVRNAAHVDFVPPSEFRTQARQKLEASHLAGVISSLEYQAVLLRFGLDADDASRRELGEVARLMGAAHGRTSSPQDSRAILQRKPRTGAASDGALAPDDACNRALVETGCACNHAGSFERTPAEGRQSAADVGAAGAALRGRETHAQHLPGTRTCPVLVGNEKNGYECCELKENGGALTKKRKRGGAKKEASSKPKAPTNKFTKPVTAEVVGQLVREALLKIPVPRDRDAASLAAFRTSVCFEDSDLLVAAKPAGKRVTPFHRLCEAGGSCLSTALAYVEESQAKCGESQSQASTATPVKPSTGGTGPPTADDVSLVHRLDVHTSGLLVFAKTKQAARKYGNAAFWADCVRKEYLAVVDCVAATTVAMAEAESDNHTSAGHKRQNATSDALHSSSNSWLVSCDIDGKTANTRVREMGRSQNGEHALLACELVQSGRHHQIRRHCAAEGLPLHGDREYRIGTQSPEVVDGIFFLHCWKLDITGVGALTASVPKAFADVARRLGIVLGSNVEAVAGLDLETRKS